MRVWLILLTLVAATIESGCADLHARLQQPPLAMNFEVRRDPLRLPPRVSFLGKPFDVVAGNAYYVRDWIGVLSRDVDFYVVVSRVEQRWDLHRVGFDFDEATAGMKRLYPAMEQIQTWSAWREDSTLVLGDVSTGGPDRLDSVDAVVAAAGSTADDELYRALRGRVADLRMIGDCVAPRTALEAIYEGHAAGRAL